MRRHFSELRAAHGLAFVVLWSVGLGIWLTGSGDGTFIRKFAEDGATMVWLQEFIANYGVAQTPEYFYPLDHPCPRSTTTVPSRTDILLFGGPWAALLSFPAQWHGFVATAVGFAALGCAALAAVLGAGFFGTAVAGVLGSTMLPVWSQMWAGQANGAWTGLVVLAIAFSFSFLRDPGDRPARLALKGAGITVAFGVAGGVYPLNVLLWIPAGLLLLLPELRRAGVLRTALAVVAVGFAVALAWGDLSRALAFHAGDFYGWGDAPGDGMPCTAEDGRLLLSALALWGTESTGYFTYGQAALGAWILVPLALFYKPLRWRILGLIVIFGIFVWISISPCPSSAPQATGIEFVQISDLTFPLWDFFRNVHRYERPLMVALGIAAVLAGLGLTALAAQGPKRRRLAFVLGVLACCQSVAILHSEISRADRWVTVDVSTVLARIDALAPKTLAIFPPSERMVYSVAIERPFIRLVNPYRPDRVTRHTDLFLSQLHDLTAGYWPEPPLASPGRGLDAIVYDTNPEWCRANEFQPAESCRLDLAEFLDRWLGPPTGEVDGVRWWSLEGGESEAVCGDHVRRPDRAMPRRPTLPPLRGALGSGEDVR
jgi:hypothetical protein